MMPSFYRKSPVTLKILRNHVIKSYSKSTQSSPPTAAAATKCATRKATKEMKVAAGASGSRSGEGCSSKTPLSPERLRQIYILNKCDMLETPKGHSKPFRLLSYCCVALIGVLAFNVLSHQEEHDVHFVPYEYMYRRTKKFFWGDHQKSFFHGPNNLIPEIEEPNYKKLPDADAENLKRRKELRNQHAKEELERRQRRREQEALKKISE